MTTRTARDGAVAVNGAAGVADGASIVVGQRRGSARPTRARHGARRRGTANGNQLALRSSAERGDGGRPDHRDGSPSVVTGLGRGSGEVCGVGEG